MGIQTIKRGIKLVDSLLAGLVVGLLHTLEGKHEWLSYQLFVYQASHCKTHDGNYI